MRVGLWLTLGFVFVACGSSDGGGAPAEGGASNQGGSGGKTGVTAGHDAGGAPSETGGSADPSEMAGAGAGGADNRGEIGTPMQIAPGQAALIGVTSDGWVIYREADVLHAAMLGDATTVEDITDRPGSVLIRGRVVFNWADINWEQGVGKLSVWTASAGAHTVGLTPYSESLVAASEDGSTIVYTANTHQVLDGAGGAGGMGGAGGAGGAGGETSAPEKASNLIISSSDLVVHHVLIPELGLGSESTCNANLGFVGQKLFIGWCAPGSRDAKIQRYELAGNSWMPTTIAENTLPAWSTDASAERVFYQSSGYNGYVSMNGDQVSVDAGVSQGTLLPDGSAVLYSVGDQLRRTSLPDVNPVAIVTTGYKQPVGFSSDFGLALYSTNVSYAHGTQRDLFLATTDGFNPQPLALVSEPVATLARSSMSRDGKFVFYLTDVTTSGGSLHVVDAKGAEVMTLPKVVEAEAAKGSLLVFTDSASNPDKYPVVANLKVIDLGWEQEPRLVEAKVLDPKNFFVNAAGTEVSYVRSGVGRDPAEADHDGVFSVTVR